MTPPRSTGICVAAAASVRSARRWARSVCARRTSAGPSARRRPSPPWSVTRRLRPLISHRRDHAPPVVPLHPLAQGLDRLALKLDLHLGAANAFAPGGEVLGIRRDGVGPYQPPHVV